MQPHPVRLVDEMIARLDIVYAVLTSCAFRAAMPPRKDTDADEARRSAAAQSGIRRDGKRIARKVNHVSSSAHQYAVRRRAHPALGLTQLKAVVARAWQRRPSHIFYLNHDFADFFGLDLTDISG